jgi:hypothetical protein
MQGVRFHLPPSTVRTELHMPTSSEIEETVEKTFQYVNPFIVWVIDKTAGAIGRATGILDKNDHINPV